MKAFFYKRDLLRNSKWCGNRAVPQTRKRDLDLWAWSLCQLMRWRAGAVRESSQTRITERERCWRWDQHVHFKQRRTFLRALVASLIKPIYLFFLLSVRSTWLDWSWKVRWFCASCFCRSLYRTARCWTVAKCARRFSFCTRGWNGPQNSRSQVT